jgi:acyl-CoA reductase-like NAD-dependent aldehyde dehydrogenase
MGSMISSNRFDGLEAIIEDANENGAHVEGGTAYNHAYLENGNYFTPTLVGPVDPSMKIAREECETFLFIGIFAFEVIFDNSICTNCTPHAL